jgi:hypothetical protein
MEFLEKMEEVGVLRLRPLLRWHLMNKAPVDRYAGFALGRH